MTPKEAYEVRKAERLAMRRKHPQQTNPQPNRDEMMEDMFDRFVTAVERIADALSNPEGSSNGK